MLNIQSANTHLTVNEAAQVLKVSVSWLNKARLTGDGPAFNKIGRRVIYDTTELSKWLESRKFVSTSAYSA